MSCFTEGSAAEVGPRDKKRTRISRTESSWVGVCDEAA